MDVLEAQVALTLARLGRKCRQLLLLEAQDESSVDVAEREVRYLARWDVFRVDVAEVDAIGAAI